MFKELKEFINKISKEEHPESEMSDDLKKKIEEKLKGPKKKCERSNYNHDETK